MTKVGNYLCLPFEWADKDGEKRFNSFFIHIPSIESGEWDPEYASVKSENLFGVDIRGVLKKMKTDE